MLSNADTKETRELYARFRVRVVSAPRVISRDAATRGRDGAARHVLGAPGARTREGGGLSGEPFSAADELALRHRMKAELRRRLRAVRQNLGESAWAERSRALVDAPDAEPVASARRVALFFPIVERREVDLRELDAPPRAGAVAYPAIDRHGRDDLPVHARAGRPRGARVRVRRAVARRAGGDGARRRRRARARGRSSGQRLGYGRGYYDRALPRVAPPAFTVAVAFDWQVVIELPVTEGDVAVDAVLTDARRLR